MFQCLVVGRRIKLHLNSSRYIIPYYIKSPGVITQGFMFQFLVLGRRIKLHLNSSRYIILAETFNHIAFRNAFEALNQDTAFVALFHFFYIVFEAF